MLMALDGSIALAHHLIPIRGSEISSDVPNHGIKIAFVLYARFLGHLGPRQPIIKL